jgi:hypothetical protein
MATHTVAKVSQKSRRPFGRRSSRPFSFLTTLKRLIEFIHASHQILQQPASHRFSRS